MDDKDRIWLLELENSTDFWLLDGSHVFGPVLGAWIHQGFEISTLFRPKDSVSVGVVRWSMNGSHATGTRDGQIWNLRCILSWKEIFMMIKGPEGEGSRGLDIAITQAHSLLLRSSEL